MRYTLERIHTGENEVVIRCREMTPEMERLLEFLQAPRRLLGVRDGECIVVDTAEVLYIESVDGRVFVYTQEDVLQVEYTLSQLEQMLDGINFFRCSKSMILNIDKVSSLRSLASNRINAAMTNGEHIVISRTYASEFRRRLKGGGRDE